TQSTTATPSNLITFAVTPTAAARIALADSDGGGVTGGIYLALEAAGNTPTAPTTINSSNLIPAGSAGAVTATVAPTTTTTTVKSSTHSSSSSTHSSSSSTDRGPNADTP
ncbi:MAG: hypothetical protein ABSC30_07435, partial [Acidimicrobiales bacterium]